MRTALRPFHTMRRASRASSSLRPPSLAISRRMYADKPAQKGYDKGTMQEAPPEESDTAVDEDAQVDTVLKGGAGSYQAKREVEAQGPTLAGDNTTAQKKDPAGKGEKGPLSPTGGDTPASTA